MCAWQTRSPHEPPPPKPRLNRGDSSQSALQNRGATRRFSRPGRVAREFEPDARAVIVHREGERLIIQPVKGRGLLEPAHDR
jgi:hypothetical protein